MNGKRILITGISGFIGTHLASVFRDAFPLAQVFGIDRNVKLSPVYASVSLVDLSDLEQLRKTLKDIKPDYIFHLAGVIYSRDWSELYRSVVGITANVFEAAMSLEYCPVIVLPGSAAEYGQVSKADLPISELIPSRPVVPYGVAKAWQTTLAGYYSARGVSVKIGRIFNIIGKGLPAELSLGAFSRQLRSIKGGAQQARIMVGNLKARRDFLDIDDICRGLIAIAERGAYGKIYNICMGKSVLLEDILNMMIQAYEVEVDIVLDPDRVQEADITDIYGSNERILLDTNWQPRISLERSVMRLCSD